MKKGMKIAIASGALIALASAYGASSYADGGRGGDEDCGWKRGGHHGAMMGGRHGGMGFFGAMMGEDRNYSADQIRTLSEAFLLRMGNDNLKVGEITATDKESYLVKVVTKDGSLVQEVEVSKKNGMPLEMMKRHGHFQKTDSE